MPQPIQQKINIRDIKENTVILENDALRAVLMTSSINFFLKSMEEQEAITLRYQEFLNSLDFSIQILITSRKFDVTDYLAMLEEKRKIQTNELLKIQMVEYVDFIKSLTEMSNIMTETFYLIIPFAPIEKTAVNFWEKLASAFSKKQEKINLEFEESRSQLWQRVEYVTAGLSRIGIKAVTLNTEELTELFYSAYNLDAKEKPKIAALKEQKMIQ